MSAVLCDSHVEYVLSVGIQTQWGEGGMSRKDGRYL